MEAFQSVKVVNRNKFALTGRFAGRNYVFEPNKGTELPMEACTHIFAFGSEQKTGALNRLGLLLPGGTLDKAMEAYNKIQFFEGRMVFAEEPRPDPHNVPQGPPGPGGPPHQQPQPQPHPAQGPQTPKGPPEGGEEEDEDKEIGASSDAPARHPGGESEAGEKPTPLSASGDLSGEEMTTMIMSVPRKATLHLKAR
jgi:hypothetical protein